MDEKRPERVFIMLKHISVQPLFQRFFQVTTHEITIQVENCKKSIRIAGREWAG